MGRPKNERIAKLGHEKGLGVKGSWSRPISSISRRISSRHSALDRHYLGTQYLHQRPDNRIYNSEVRLVRPEVRPKIKLSLQEH